MRRPAAAVLALLVLGCMFCSSSTAWGQGVIGNIGVGRTFPPGAPLAPATTPGFQGQTLWRFLGIPQAREQFRNWRDTRINRNGNNPQRERKPPLKRLADPSNLESDNPAIKKAAEIKMEEDMAAQKVKAIKYLATICCGCYGGVEDALLAALEDCTEEVRYEAAQALLCCAGNKCKTCNGNCCSEKALNKMAERLYEKDEDGCDLEKSQRVREVLKKAISACQKPVPPGYYPPVGEDPADDPAPAPKAGDEIKGDDEVGPEAGETTQVLPNGLEITAPRMAKTLKPEVSPTITLDEAVVQPQGIQPPVVATPKVERAILQEAPAKPYFEEQAPVIPAPALPAPVLPGPSLLGPEARTMESEVIEAAPEAIVVDDFVQTAPSYFEGKISGIYAGRGLAQLQLPGECRVKIGDQVGVFAGSRSLGSLKVVGFAGPHAVAQPQGSLSADALKQGQLVKVAREVASVAQAPVLRQNNASVPAAVQVAVKPVATQPAAKPVLVAVESAPAPIIRPVVLEIDVQDAIQQPNHVRQADLPDAPLPPQ